MDEQIKTLIVDDSPEDRRLFGEILSLIDNVSVIGSCVDGLDGLAYLHRTDAYNVRSEIPSPDLVLLDFDMPRCDGIEFLSRTRYCRNRPRIILWSSCIDRIDVGQAVRLGADIVTGKPATAGELLDLLNQVTFPAMAPGEFPAHIFAKAEEARIHALK
jgi:CheY-like chemotaxis protein